MARKTLYLKSFVALRRNNNSMERKKLKYFLKLCNFVYCFKLMKAEKFHYTEGGRWCWVVPVRSSARLFKNESCRLPSFSCFLTNGNLLQIIEGGYSSCSTVILGTSKSYSFSWAATTTIFLLFSRYDDTTAIINFSMTMRNRIFIPAARFSSGFKRGAKVVPFQKQLRLKHGKI